MKAKITFQFSLVSLFFLFLISCEKVEIDTETQTAQDNSIAEASFMQVFPTIHAISVNEEGIKKTGSYNTCATVEIKDTANFPNSPATITVDYGVDGCSDDDGKLKKGKLKAVIFDKWANTGAKVVVSFENYYVNDVKCEGVMTAVNNGNNSYTITVEDGKCITADFTIGYNSSVTITQFEGAATIEDTDDAFEFTGNANGTNRDGKTYDSKITTPLIKRNSCKWIEKGIFEVTPQDIAARTVNYGDGTCDDDATITINKQNFQFKLK